MTGLAVIANILILIFWLQGVGKNPTWEHYPNLELQRREVLIDSIFSKTGLTYEDCLALKREGYLLNGELERILQGKIHLIEKGGQNE